MRLQRTFLLCVSLLLVLISILHVAQPFAATVTVKQFVTCKAIDETKSPYEPEGVTDVFFTTQEKVWALVVLEDVQPPTSVSIAYYLPDGREYGRATEEFKGVSIISYAVFLDISKVGRYTGLWRVEAYVEGTLVSAIYFELNPPGPRLRFVDASYKPGEEEQLYVGDLATAAYTLENVGVAAATKVEFRVVDSPSEVVVVETTKASDLSPGSSGRWQVVMRPEKADTFKIVLNVFMNNVKQTFRFLGKSETFDTFTITLTASLKPAFLVIQRVVTQPNASEPFYVGDVGTITYVVQNAGQLAGKNVEIRVVSAPAEIELVQVSGPKDIQPGATDEWQVKVKATKPGTYEIYVSFYVNGEKVIFQAEGQAHMIEEFKTTITTVERPFLETYGLFIALGVIVLVIIAAVVLLMKRRGHAATAPPPVPVPPTRAPTVMPPPAVPGGKFCVNCGSQIPEASAFCPRCGAQQP